jgi:hypothetical protein
VTLLDASDEFGASRGSVEAFGPHQQELLAEWA